MDARKQEDIDRALIALDGTPNKARLGANATVAVSLAALHAAARAQGLPLFRYLAQGGPVRLPLPEIQIFGGGAHAGRRIDIQDLMVMALAATSFDEALEMTARVYHAAGELMRDAGKLHGIADEGGWWPEFASNEEAIETLVRAIERAGFVPATRSRSRSTSPRRNSARGGRYRLGLDGSSLDSDGMCELVLGWLARYPIVSVEDPLAEDDREGMMRFTARGRRPGADHRRRLSDHQRRARAGRGRRPRLQRRAAQAQPVRHGDRDARGAGRGQGRAAGAASSRRARAKPRT